MKVLLFIDGIISAGKSTKLQQFREKYPNICVISEPVQKWIQSGLLQAFYSEPKKYAFALQSFIIDSFNDQLEEAFKNGANFILMERGHLSAHTIFSTIHYREGRMTREEYMKMEEKHHAYNRQLRENGYILDHIYLATPIDVAMERLAIRDRENEKTSVTREYQQSLIDRFTEMGLTPYTEEQLCSLVEKINEMLKIEKLQNSIFSVM